MFPRTWRKTNHRHVEMCSIRKVSFFGLAPNAYFGNNPKDVKRQRARLKPKNNCFCVSLLLFTFSGRKRFFWFYIDCKTEIVNFSTYVRQWENCTSNKVCVVWSFNRRCYSWGPRYGQTTKEQVCC